jgi:uncharacterized membrane protein YtjA (UPF0391 family)
MFPNRQIATLAAARLVSAAFQSSALIAAVLGFTGLAGTSSSIAQILFLVFHVLFLIGLLAGHRVRA